jgi:DNA-directed RNA polymerase specialized sigma24 family protein
MGVRVRQSGMRSSTGRTDRDLLSAVAGGAPGALKELYERHSPWLGIRLRQRCNDPELVAEVLQDTFVAAWQEARRFRGDGMSQRGCGASGCVG